MKRSRRLGQERARRRARLARRAMLARRFSPWSCVVCAAGMLDTGRYLDVCGPRCYARLVERQTANGYRAAMRAAGRDPEKRNYRA